MWTKAPLTVNQFNFKTLQCGASRHLQSVLMWVKNGWRWFRDTWGATVQCDFPETQRECRKAHRLDVCFIFCDIVFPNLFSSFEKVSEGSQANPYVCSRYVAGAASSCPESDAAGWGYPDCSCGESTQSPAAGARVQVHQWAEGLRHDLFLPSGVWLVVGLVQL